MQARGGLCAAQATVQRQSLSVIQCHMPLQQDSHCPEAVPKGKTVQPELVSGDFLPVSCQKAVLAWLLSSEDTLQSVLDLLDWKVKRFFFSDVAVCLLHAETMILFPSRRYRHEIKLLSAGREGDTHTQPIGPQKHHPPLCSLRRCRECVSGTGICHRYKTLLPASPLSLSISHIKSHQELKSVAVRLAYSVIQ